MSLHSTTLLMGSRASGYGNRVMVYAHRRNRASYLAPKRPHRQDPTANKPMEEYGNTWDPRTGIDWYYRMRNRNHYRHWPWARWTDDPVRLHEDPTHRRTFSALSPAVNEGMPEWNYYAEVGQDYRTPSHFPLRYVAPFVHQYTGKVWSMATLEAHLEAVAEGTGLRTIAEVAANRPALERWGQSQTGKASAVPWGLLVHISLVAGNIVQQNQRVAHRHTQHAAGGLRTREMEPYFTLPHQRSGPAMPDTLAQPSGEYPWGPYTYMKKGAQIHPLQRPDARYGHNMYPM